MKIQLYYDYELATDADALSALINKCVYRLI